MPRSTCIYLVWFKKKSLIQTTKMSTMFCIYLINHVKWRCYKAISTLTSDPIHHFYILHDGILLRSQESYNMVAVWANDAAWIGKADVNIMDRQHVSQITVALGSEALGCEYYRHLFVNSRFNCFQWTFIMSHLHLELMITCCAVPWPGGPTDFLAVARAID